MSLYRFIASDHPLIEVDHSGFTELKVKDIKKLEPVPPPPAIFQSWDEMDDEATVLYAKDESDLGGLRLSLCENPPYDLEHYIEKKYIYWLEGDFHSKCLEQLTEYVKLNVQANDHVELWSIWFGDGIKSATVKSVHLNEVSIEDFDILRSHECCCLRII